jgi:hypothetical protein
MAKRLNEELKLHLCLSIIDETAEDIEEQKAEVERQLVGLRCFLGHDAYVRLSDAIGDLYQAGMEVAAYKGLSRAAALR